jgi:F420H(2)-dependent quinone reductase
VAGNPPDTGGAEYRPSARERVRDQVAAYEATDGAQGGDLGGRPVIILTSIGASSGAIRKTPIMKVLDGDRYVAIASFAGAPDNPAWYRNLIAHPDVEVQDGAEHRRLHAREIHGAEKTRLWEIADAANPAYAGYRASAGRDIPILLLEPPADES